MMRFQRNLHAKILALVATCVLLTEAGKGRLLSSPGDILGTLYDPTSKLSSEEPKKFPRSREVEDHAHFYNAANVLTRWAESTFALTAYAHKQLYLQPGGMEGSACVYDSVQCLFNPYMVGAKSFPAPEQIAEHVLKRFALEAYVCRQAADRPNCHLDTNCDWDDVTGACYLAHDPHSNFISSITPCKDMIYTAIAAACWRRKPQLDSIRPCGGAACKLFKAGTGSAWLGGGGGGGLPEDRCMPYLSLSKLIPTDMYSLLKRHFGPEVFTAEQLANATLAAQALAAKVQEQEQEQEQEQQKGPPLVVGYGNCSTAMLHYTMRTACRVTTEEACRVDAGCTWTKVLYDKHCVLSPERVIDLLLGTSKFTRAVRKGEAACRRATSESACMNVVLTL